MAKLFWILEQAEHYQAGHVHIETDGQIRFRMGEALKELCEVTPEEHEALLGELGEAVPDGWTATAMETLHGLRIVLSRIQAWAQAAEIQAALQPLLGDPQGILAVATPPRQDLAGLLLTCRQILPEGWEIHGRTTADLSIALALLRARSIQATVGIFVDPTLDPLRIITESF